MATLQASLDEAIKARELAQAALQNEKVVMMRRVSELEEQKLTIERKLTIATQTLLQPTSSPTDVGEIEDDTTLTSSTPPLQETASVANKKKKKKKKKGGPVGTTASLQREVEDRHEEQDVGAAKDSCPRRLLEDYLVAVHKSLHGGHLNEIAFATSQLIVGNELWNESIARGMRPSQLEGLKTTVDSLLNDALVAAKVQTLDVKLSAFAKNVTNLAHQLEEVNVTQATLKSKLRNAEADLQSAITREQQLVEKNRRLESASEEVEQLRDMLRDVGGDLVEAKDKIKHIEKKETAVQLTKSELEATISKLTIELNESKEKARLIDNFESQVSQAESAAESRLKELNEAKEMLKSVESDITMLKTELAKVSADKNDLLAKLADAQVKLRQLERSEKEARDRVIAIQASLTSKEKEVASVRTELNNVQNLKTQLEENLRSNRLELSRIDSERREIQLREQNARDESTKFKREADLYRDKIGSLESIRTSLTSDRDNLAEAIRMKTTQLETTQTLMQNLREQTTEMGHRTREAKERCESLEEELTEAHKLLGERAGEAVTMRRLLDEAEGREAGRIQRN